MTVPAAFEALAVLLAETLREASFIADVATLFVDDPDAVGPGGDETEFLTWAALTRGETRTVRTILGRPAQRFVIEHRASLELAWAGPDQASGKIALARALAAVAALPISHPTLGGEAERFFVEAASEEPLAPNGWQTTLACAFRLRSADPLGLNP